MANDKNSLAHMTRNCKCHASKYRRDERLPLPINDLLQDPEQLIERVKYEDGKQDKIR
ncbi:hypothetical protein [Anaerotruncus rubiinfantis]|uniref:hypothetical protein n=1 Tax=Anaerotruncus rubiinfantis TaxID=1720200 RepID=UPI0034A28966